jgi:hypothetical protein
LTFATPLKLRHNEVAKREKGLSYSKAAAEAKKLVCNSMYMLLMLKQGLPDGLFSDQKFIFRFIFVGLGMENFGCI